MLSRAVLILITVFWLTMNVLLWRAEVGPRTGAAGAVPVELVWNKVLTSPDSSSLSITHHGRKLGFCHWITGVGEAWASVGEEDIPNGAPKAARSYLLRLEGSALADGTNRIRFDGSLKVDARRAWRELDARVNVRPVTWQIHSTAAKQELKFSTQNGEDRVEHTFKFADLRDPGKLAGEFMGPFAGEWLYQMGRPQTTAAAPTEPLIKWEASEDTLWIQQRQVRVYRLQTRLLDRYSFSLFVSRVGEILRVELPDEWILVNDQLVIL